MAFGIGGSSGGAFVGSVVSDEVYDPVFDTNTSALFLWQLLPDFYRNLMDDQDLVETTWSGMIQAVASDLLALWTNDYSKSLNTVPVISQRKWILFDLNIEVDLATDPGLVTNAVPGIFTYNQDEELIDCAWVTRNRRDKITVPLLGETTEGASLAWSFEVNLSSVQKGGVALWGYYSSQDDPLRDALTVGILGSTSTVDTPVPVIMHFAPEAVVTKVEGTFVLSMDTDYRFDCTYTARTGVVVAAVTEISAVKHSGTEGQTSNEFGSVFTNVLTDLTVNFETIALVGDFLVYEGVDLEIISVDGSSLTVREITLPVEVDDIVYDIIGEEEKTSISIDLPSEAGNPRFAVDQFGTSTLDIRSVTPSVFPSPALHLRRTVTGTTKGWVYFEPTVDDIILSLPRFQGVITDPQELLFEGTDYAVENRSRLFFSNLTDITGVIAVGNVVTSATGVAVVSSVSGTEIIASPREGFFIGKQTLAFSGGAGAKAGTVTEAAATSAFKFQEVQTESLWAEYVGYDEARIANNFGSNVGLFEKSSDSYKAKVRGLYFAYFQGPTVSAIRIGVHILIGLPIAERAGTVESINPAFSGTVGLITIDGIDYQYPLVVGTPLLVGDTVEQFEPLSFGVEIIDYLIDPEWFVAVTFAEIKKYHSFQVQLDLDAFEVSTLAQAGTFVDQIKPTWKTVLYLLFKNLVDEVEMIDDLAIGITLRIFDEPCDVPPLVAYDNNEYEGNVADHIYDQGPPAAPWSDTSAAMREWSTELTGLSALVNGSTTMEGTGTDYVTEIGAPASKYLLAALRLTTDNGETSAGDNEFVDNTVNFTTNGLEVGDAFDVSGEGTFTVLSIDGANQVTLDAPLGLTATGVTWTSTGLAKVWGAVNTITDVDTLDFTTTFTGLTGNYLVSLLGKAPFLANEFLNAHYDYFFEGCPDEDFELRIEWTAGLAPGMTTVPAADPTNTATHDFDVGTELYTVVLDEPTP